MSIEETIMMQNGGVIPDLSDAVVDNEELTGEGSTEYEHGSIMQGEPILKRRVDNVAVNVHCSSLHKMMTGNFGLSENQKVELQKLEERVKPKTELQEIKYEQLIEKRDNPDIGETAKTYINEMITLDLYQIPKYMHTKYTHHGNVNEQHSIDMLNLYLGTSFDKNEERKISAEWMLSGEIDINAKKELNAIIDIKNPYDTFTFDRNRYQPLLVDYDWQMQGYMQLWDVENAYVIYTLNENMYMEDQSLYEQFGFLDRVIIKHVKRDREKMAAYKERIPTIRKCIKDAKIKRMEYMVETDRIIQGMLTM